MQEARREKHLVDRSRDGDRDAFDDLVRDHFERVYAFLLRMIGNHEDAEDLAQECFVRAFRSLSHFRGESRFATWVYRIAVHLARDHHRARQRHGQPLHLSGELSDSIEGPPAEPADAMSHQELVSALSLAIQKLPHSLRAALVLRVLEGLEYDEVAAATGMRPGTVRTQVMKARRILRDLIQVEPGDES